MDREIIDFVKKTTWTLAEEGPHGFMVLAVTLNGICRVEIPCDCEIFPQYLFEVLRYLGATAYIIVTDVWGTLFDDDAGMNSFTNSGKAIEDLPMDDRFMAVHIVVCEKGEETRLWESKITETQLGRKLTPWVEHVGLGGRLVLDDW